MSTCKSVQEASDTCQLDGAFLGAPEECRDAVWFSYLANQDNVHVAKTDAAQEGTWVRGYSKSVFF